VPASNGDPRVNPETPAAATGPDRLDDPDYPAYTTGRAADALGVQQAFLRALDAAGALTPVRSEGGHRRYTRRQLAFARRIRELFDQGHNLGSSLQILALQDELATEQARVAGLRDQLRQQGDEEDREAGPKPGGETSPAEAAGAEPPGR
jgi:MerR family transcriptional regulator, heat shock protein HspR